MIAALNTIIQAVGLGIIGFSAQVIIENSADQSWVETLGTSFT